MASDASFIEYVRDQMQGAGQVTFRKMFGEYALYCDGKVVALVCDNQVFIKPTVVGRAMLGSVTEAPPYPGAKPHFQLGEELDDPPFMAELIRKMVSELPLPVPKKPRFVAV